MWKLILITIGLCTGPHIWAQTTQQNEPRQVVKYRCHSNRLVRVEYPIAESASTPIILHWSGYSYTLTPTANPKETRYINRKLIWRKQGDSGYLTTRGGRMLAQDCQRIKL